ncbi:hypothetical protein NBO_612g0004 [Nosema bombycis CQ1]|uniref:Uncharacterized protein n=1 Tax=Nosema bombycis (strain CQ1 / CVCC 102059) TaxID=578461 RepID=R0M1S0_NOSB1|nr:hypothetical protein NBO_612g0004 [Nosema bombycis CQ1]|eukprot:EOB11964.1 hypothetical protein NBO_612g0004 [Nosema bombycis CQ1]
MKKTITFLLLSTINSSTKNGIENTTLNPNHFSFASDEVIALSVNSKATASEEHKQTSLISTTANIKQEENVSTPIVINKVVEMSVDIDKEFQRLTITDESNAKNINDKRFKTMTVVSKDILTQKKSKKRSLKKSKTAKQEKDQRKKLLKNEVEKRKLKRQKRDLKMQEQKDCI